MADRGIRFGVHSEYGKLHDLVLPLIEKDPEARHVAMPPARPHTPSGEGPGPFLEGGDILICGRDILVGQHDERVSLASIKRITGTIALFVGQWCGLERA